MSLFVSAATSAAGAVANVVVGQALKQKTSTFTPYEPEGLTLLVQLGILANYDGKTPSGTLIGFKENRIEYYPPYSIDQVQGVSRWWNDVEAADLSSLSDYLKKCMRRISRPDDNDKIKAEIQIIAEFATAGLIALQTSYEVHKSKTPKKCAHVKDYIEHSITVFQNQTTTKEGDTPIDIKVSASYKEGEDITFVANQIKKLANKKNSVELKHQYVELLNAWVETKLTEFKNIQKSVA